MKSRRFLTNAKMWLASWVIFFSLLPLQSGFAAMSCLLTANLMMCHCGRNCSRLLKKQPEPDGIVHSQKGQTGILHQVLETTVIGDTNNRDFPCGLVCSLQLPPAEIQILRLQQQRVTEPADYVREQNFVSLMPCGQPTSHSPPSAWRSLPSYIIFSSLLI